MLDEQPASPVVLAGKLDQPLGTVSYHVRILYDVGLLDLVSTRQRRGATEHIYKARAHPFLADMTWEELEATPEQRTIGAALSQVHEFASRSAAAGGFDQAESQFTRTPMTLDRRAFAELGDAAKTWLQEASRIERDAAERLDGDSQLAHEVALVLLLFEALPFSASLHIGA
jgi:DNA-binding transcriptional ArsR family regulator